MKELHGNSLYLEFHVLTAKSRGSIPGRETKIPQATQCSPKGDQSWVFLGRTDAEAFHANTLATSCEELTHWKRPWCWEGLGAEGEGDDRGWDGWMASPTGWAWIWVNSGVGDGQGGLACCDSWGGKELDMTERLNWTELRKGRDN